MADLGTTYLGMKLRSPLVPSASTLSGEVEDIKRMEQAGAGAVILHSLFEEEMILEEYELHRALFQGAESFPEAITHFPELGNYGLGPGRYLQHIRDAKQAVKIPVIASLNGDTRGGWVSIAKSMEEAGADALELNVYAIPTDVDRTGAQVEADTLELFQSVKSIVKIPVAVKLSPFFSNMANMAKRFSEEGAGALVLFNRFYQPDLDLENREVVPQLFLSTPMSFRLPLRWVAILFGQVKCNLAATSGIHQGEDALKAVMAGADVAMLCSTLLKNGIEHIHNIEADMRRWMEEHDFDSISQMKGSLSQKNCPDPSAFERVQYLKTLKSFRPGPGFSGMGADERWDV